ncbi:MAG: DUF2938 family protein [Pseudomonadota bacterium]|nr:DUF2938 family protein [Pseudomonadota bacterium]
MSLFGIFLAGILSCIAMDFWQRLLLALFKIPTSNWAMVGRWLILFAGSFKWVQESLSDHGAIRGELLIGWLFHYFVGILYALFYALLWSLNLIDLGIVPGFLFGLVSTVVPWFLFMPAMGAGVLSRKSETQLFNLFLAMMTHIVFGVSLGLVFSYTYVG